MLDSMTVDQLTKSIYQVSSGLENIGYFLKKTGKAFNSHLVGCVAVNMQDFSTKLPFFMGVPDRELNEFNNYYTNKNVIHRAFLPALFNGQVVSSADYFTNTELAKTEFYTGFMRGLDAHYTAGFMVASMNDHNYSLIMARPKSKGAFTSEEKSVLSTLRMHTESAMQIYSRLNTFKSVIRTSSNALDRLNMGVCILGEQLKILEANVTANDILGQGEFLSTDHGSLINGSSSCPPLIGLLNDLSCNAVMSNHKTKLFDEQTGMECFLNIFPILDADEFWWVESRQARYILFIDVQTTPNSNCLNYLKMEFSLTERELELVSLLETGHSLTSTAVQLQIAHETARSHMKSIFRKMNIHSQAQLAVIVSKLNLVQ